jgi:hypothetical protein
MNQSFLIIYITNDHPDDLAANVANFNRVVTGEIDAHKPPSPGTAST